MLFLYPGRAQTKNQIQLTRLNFVLNKIPVNFYHIICDIFFNQNKNILLRRYLQILVICIIGKP